MITAEDILHAVHRIVEEEHPENAVGEHEKPRASSIADCDRAVAYYMAGTPISDDSEDNPDRIDNALTNEEGSIGEGLTAKALERLGFRVIGRDEEGKQKALPADYPVTGHVDGTLVPVTMAAAARPDSDKRWGWDNKRYGRIAYLNCFKYGLEQAKPEVIAQVVLYGDALGWDKCLVTVVAQDASVIRSERTQQIENSKKIKKDGTPYKFGEWALRDDFNAKVQVFEVDLHRYDAWVPVLHQRARWFTEWKQRDGNPAHVLRNFDPEVTNFPCGWCEHRSKCIEDEEGEVRAASLPFERS